MALAITIENRGYFSNLQYVQGRLAADASWLTAGEPLVPADLGMDSIFFINIEEQGGIVFNWSRTAQTVLAYRTGSGDNVVLSVVVDGQDIASVATSIEFFAIGR
jgi:hypothetical protein